MNKLTVLMLLTCFSVSLMLSACSTKADSGQVLNYKRKFQNFGTNVEQPTKKQTYDVIDLSDGKKVDYNTPIGPSFDIQY